MHQSDRDIYNVINYILHAYPLGSYEQVGMCKAWSCIYVPVHKYIGSLGVAVAVDYEVSDSGGLRWRTGINITTLR